MKQKMIIIILIIILITTLTSCKKYVEFELSGLAFVLIFPVVLALIGLIVMLFKNGDRNK